jgi:hypothetical protein
MCIFFNSLNLLYSPETTDKKKINNIKETNRSSGVNAMLQERIPSMHVCSWIFIYLIFQDPTSFSFLPSLPLFCLVRTSHYGHKLDIFATLHPLSLSLLRPHCSRRNRNFFISLIFFLICIPVKFLLNLTVV